MEIYISEKIRMIRMKLQKLYYYYFQNPSEIVHIVYVADAWTVLAPYCSQFWFSKLTF